MRFIYIENLYLMLLNIHICPNVCDDYIWKFVELEGQAKKFQAEKNCDLIFNLITYIEVDLYLNFKINFFLFISDFWI